MYGYGHMSAGSLRVQKVLKLQVVVDILTWVLRSELKSSVRAVNPLNLGALSPAPQKNFLMKVAATKVRL